MEGRNIFSALVFFFLIFFQASRTDEASANSSRCTSGLVHSVADLAKMEFVGKPIFRIELLKAYHFACDKSGGRVIVLILIFAQERPYAVWDLTFGKNSKLIQAVNISKQWKFADLELPWWFVLAQEEQWQKEWCAAVQIYSREAFAKTGCIKVPA